LKVSDDLVKREPPLERNFENQMI